MIKKSNKKWNKKDILLIVNYRKNKMSYKLIAHKLNVTINSIYKTLKRYKAENTSKNPNSFLKAINWFNEKFPNNKIEKSPVNFGFILNKEAYSKTSILLILNKLLLKYNYKTISDNKFINYRSI